VYSIKAQSAVVQQLFLKQNLSQSNLPLPSREILILEKIYILQLEYTKGGRERGLFI
jgi:hypothetical protein